MARTNLEYQRWLPKAAASDLFPFAYQMKLINTIEELKQILAIPTDYLRV